MRLAIIAVLLLACGQDAPEVTRVAIDATMPAVEHECLGRCFDAALAACSGISLHQCECGKSGWVKVSFVCFDTERNVIDLSDHDGNGIPKWAEDWFDERNP